jgi:hypothetical protein
MTLAPWAGAYVYTLARINRSFGVSRERTMTVSCLFLK